MPARAKASGRRKRPDLYLFATTVLVSDRKRSVTWYTEKLGFEVIQDLGHWVTVGHRGTHGRLHLCQADEIGAELEPGLQGITLHLRGDFRKKCAELARRGVRFEQPPKRMPWGTFARIADPDENLLVVNPED